MRRFLLRRRPPVRPGSAVLCAAALVACAALGATACDEAAPVLGNTAPTPVLDEEVPAPDDTPVGPDVEEPTGPTTALPPCPAAEPSDDPLVVAVREGNVRGARTEHGRRFLGVPYAAPPTGALRFRAPEPAACRAPDSVLPARDWAPACPQLGVDFNGLPDLVRGEESCLFLNVWTPEDASPDAKKPVLFFIHGGGNVLGETGQGLPELDRSVYEGTRLGARGDAVVVSVQYRLGALGFLAHDALTAEAGTSGNYGLQDIILALRWVRDSIGAFGGDAERVFVFGESAGAANTCGLLAAPSARGLFSAAGMQSGGCDAAPLVQRSREGRDVAQQVGCDGSSADDVAACLRRTSVGSLVRALMPIPDPVDTWHLPYGLVADGVVLPVSPIDALRAGTAAPVPLLIGSNADEMRFFVPPGTVNTCIDYRLALRALFGRDRAAAIRDSYSCFSAGFPYETFIAATSDLVFTCQARRAASAHAAHGHPVFRYHFRDRANTGPTVLLGAHHAAELFYLFDSLTQLPGYISSSGERELGRRMQRLWGRFAAAGDPNPEGEAVWPRWTDGGQLLILDETPFGDVRVEAGGSGRVDRGCAFWDSLAR